MTAITSAVLAIQVAISIPGAPLSALVLSVMAYGFAGWLWESTVCAMLNHGSFSNSGFLLGPCCPIYGVGALVCWFALRGVEKVPVQFLAAGVLCCCIEYLVGVILEVTTHARFWDYSDMPLNFQGRICLYGFLMFGAGCVLICRVAEPALLGMLASMPVWAVRALALAALTLLAVDAAASMASFRRLSDSLEELRELAKTAGYPVVGTATQRLQSPVAATFMGSGRLLELKDYMEAAEADLIIFDEELSPAQLRNIEELCDCPVLDRTMLILDIFAARAVSGEGKLQVELARLQYQLPRLAGRGVQLSRQGGGGAGGTGARRGAGETKLEVDRRHIRRRIDALKTELAALARRREQRRTRRKKDGITTVAIVGYTNVGKSTLLNTLTEAGVLAEDKLFATLDPTSRALALPDGRSVMLIDTVGLVRRLPHQLVEAFHSTLEEAANADLILSVCDITSPELLEQRAVTERLLEELGVEGTPVITVLNKCDAAPDAENEPYKGCVRISAKTGYGLPQLLAAIAETLPPGRIRCRLCLPYTEGGLLHRLEQQGQIFSREYTAEGTLLEAEVEQRDWRLYESYLKTED